MEEYLFCCTQLSSQSIGLIIYNDIYHYNRNIISKMLGPHRDAFNINIKDDLVNTKTG